MRGKTRNAEQNTMNANNTVSLRLTIKQHRR